MRIRYSILVRQYTLSEKGYFFWKTLRDINQTQGTLYDIQPGVVRGNIHSLTDKNEVVLGYFDAATVSEVRTFFTPMDFRDTGYRPPRYLNYCNDLDPVRVPFDGIGEYMEKFSSVQQLYETSGANPATILVLPIECVDCTAKGTNIKPPFWP